MVKLTKDDKQRMCEELTEYLPKIRSLLNVTQAELGDLCGFSRIRVSQIETGAAKMTWSQLTSIVLVCFMNIKAKEYFLANGLLGKSFLQFLQCRDENIPPEPNIIIREDIIKRSYYE